MKKQTDVLAHYPDILCQGQLCEAAHISKRQLADLPNVLTVAQLSAATGYNVRTVGQWLRRGRMRYIMLGRAYHIPKAWAIDYLCSEVHNDTHRKSPQHVAALWAAYEEGVTA